MHFLVSFLTFSQIDVCQLMGFMMSNDVCSIIVSTKMRNSFLLLVSSLKFFVFVTFCLFFLTL